MNIELSKICIWDLQLYLDSEPRLGPGTLHIKKKHTYFQRWAKNLAIWKPHDRIDRIRTPELPHLMLYSLTSADYCAVSCSSVSNYKNGSMWWPVTSNILCTYVTCSGTQNHQYLVASAATISSASKGSRKSSSSCGPTGISLSESCLVNVQAKQSGTTTYPILPESLT